MGTLVCAPTFSGYLVANSPHGLGYLVGIHAASTGIEDIFIDSTLAIDLIGCAALDDTSLLEDINLVGIDDLPDVVGDNNHSASALDGINACLDLLGGNSIETGCRFVKEDDGWILNEHTGDSHTLLLSAAELEGTGLET